LGALGRPTSLVWVEMFAMDEWVRPHFVVLLVVLVCPAAWPESDLSLRIAGSGVSKSVIPAQQRR
jgi:hypothetical protein